MDPRIAVRTHSTGSEARLSLATLLSFVLVAYTIEFDNAFEQLMPHRTTRHGTSDERRRTPWLVSLVMWANAMQYVDDDGISVREFHLRAGARKADTRMLLERLSKWWGYVRVEMAPGSAAHGPDSIVRPTSAGREARRIWRELFATIENRWCERFGTEAIARLRAALENFVDAIGNDLPEYLPILGYGLASGGREGEPRRSAPPPPARGERSRLPLSALLSKVLLTFAIAFEEESDVSLAICANVLRVVDDDVVLVRELSGRSGVSKEAIDMATGYLVRHGYAKLETRSAPNRAKALVLTSEGRRARAEYRRLTATLEERWVARFGAELVRELRASLEAVTGSDGTPLLPGLEPPPGGWRAEFPRAETLPHFPMVLHRGGFPDGS
jgi:DNA-binding MarR family transcriptional regulator